MNNIISEIKKSNNIVLLCHNNPDGDAVGSTIAMYHILNKLDKHEQPKEIFIFISLV